MLLLAAGIAGGMFVAGCSSKDVRQEAVATVNGDEIKGTELREFLGVPAGVFAVVDIPVETKKEALDQLVAVRLLAQEGRSRGIDNTTEYKEILQRNDPLVRIKALVRKEIEAKLKVTNEEIKAEIAKVKEANKGISDADAATRAVKSVSDSRIRKIQEDLIAAAKKETLAAVDNRGGGPDRQGGERARQRRSRLRRGREDPLRRRQEDPPWSVAGRGRARTARPFEESGAGREHPGAGNDDAGPCGVREEAGGRRLRGI